VFVLTTSEADEDKVEAYNLRMAGYIRKPMHSWKQRRCWTRMGGWSNFPLRDLRSHFAARLMQLRMTA
jgi:hypothetical protein